MILSGSWFEVAGLGPVNDALGQAQEINAGLVRFANHEQGLDFHRELG